MRTLNHRAWSIFIVLLSFGGLVGCGSKVVRIAYGPLSVPDSLAAQILGATEVANVSAEFILKDVEVQVATGQGDVLLRTNAENTVKASMRFSPRGEFRDGRLQLNPDIKAFDVAFAQPITLTLQNGVTANVQRIGTNTKSEITAEVQLRIFETIARFLAGGLLEVDQSPDPSSTFKALVKTATLHEVRVDLKEGATVKAPTGPIVLGGGGLASLTDAEMNVSGAQLAGNFRALLPAVKGTLIALGDKNLSVNSMKFDVAGRYTRSRSSEILELKGTDAGEALSVKDSSFNLGAGKGAISVHDTKWALLPSRWSKDLLNRAETFSLEMRGGLHGSIDSLALGKSVISSRSLAAPAATLKLSRLPAARGTFRMHFAQGLNLEDWSIRHNDSATSSLVMSGKALPVGPVELTDLGQFQLTASDVSIGINRVVYNAGDSKIDLDLGSSSRIDLDGGEPLTFAINPAAGKSPFTRPFKISSNMPTVALSKGDSSVTLTNVQSDLSIDPSKELALAGTIKSAIPRAELASRIEGFVKGQVPERVGAMVIAKTTGIADDAAITANIDLNSTERRAINIGVDFREGAGVELTGSSPANSPVDLAATLKGVSALGDLASRSGKSTLRVALSNRSYPCVYKDNVGPFNNGLFIFIDKFNAEVEFDVDVAWGSAGTVTLTPRAWRRVGEIQPIPIKADIRQAGDPSVVLSAFDAPKVKWSWGVFRGDFDNPILRLLNSILDKPFQLR